MRGRKRCKRRWNSAMPFLGEAAGVQPQRLPQKGAAQARPPAVGRPVARRAPDDGGLVADLPAGPAVVAQRRRRARTLAVAAQVKRDRRPGRAARLVADQVGGRPVAGDHVGAVFLDVALLQRRQRPQVFQAAQRARRETRPARSGGGRTGNARRRGAGGSAAGRIAAGGSPPAAGTACARIRAGSAAGPCRRGATGPAASTRRGRGAGRAAW